MKKKILRIGIDGGGTKTCCVIIDENENIVSKSKVGSTNVNSLGMEKATENIKLLLTEAISNLSNENFVLRGLGAGLSGCDRKADSTTMTNSIQKFLEEKKIPLADNFEIIVDNDAITALAAGTHGDLTGIVLISGTGYICFGFKEKSIKKKGESIVHKIRAGGWGPKLLDRGSGYWIGQQVLVRLTEINDGFFSSQNHQQFYDHFVKKYNLNPFNEVIPLVYHQCKEWSDIAKFAKDCFDFYYDTKNEIAKEIIDEVVSTQFKSIQKVAERMTTEFKKEEKEKQQFFSLVLSGTILTHENSIITQLLKKKIETELSHLIKEVTFAKVEIEKGAALIFKD